jgi:hypothetical protein
MTFTEWLAEGQKNVAGVVDIVNASSNSVWIKPDAFPEERLYFSTAKWTVQERRQRLGGVRVQFDCPPQEIPKFGKPVASNMRLQGSAKAEWRGDAFL